MGTNRDITLGIYFKDLVDRESMEFPQHRIHAQIISLAA